MPIPPYISVTQMIPKLNRNTELLNFCLAHDGGGLVQFLEFQELPTDYVLGHHGPYLTPSAVDRRAATLTAQIMHLLFLQYID